MLKTVLTAAIAVGLLAVIRSSAQAQTGCDTSSDNAAAVNSAMDPSVTPPIRQLSFAENGEYAKLGPPGPYYPDRAARMGTGGVTVMTCDVGKDGRLAACRILAETPTCFAFGVAALKMAQPATRERSR